MDKIIIEGVRCFADRQEVPLRPLTVLVGENSSGKSTFLALTRIAWDLAYGLVDVDFNEEPFFLGAYEQIASWPSIRIHQSQFFTIGAEQKRRSPKRVEGIFSKKDAQPQLGRWILDSGGYHIESIFSATRSTPRAEVLTPSAKFSIYLRHVRALGNSLTDHLSSLKLGISEILLSAKKKSEELPTEEEAKVLYTLLGEYHPRVNARPLAFAPLRAQPQRTYEFLSEKSRAEGSHVPIILASMDRQAPDIWHTLKSQIKKFGRASGLFTDLKIRHLGPQESDPFQLVVNVAGPAFNLVDVGYGVSQLLPIIVDILRSAKGRIFLLQQPEVHLHPRAQAELGTFLATVAKTQKKRFVVETHSDYLVDRIRMDIRDRKILKAEDVIILYFERAGGKTTIHPIEIDEFGNLKNVPKGYRSFFLEEERRFLEGER